MKKNLFSAVIMAGLMCLSVFAKEDNKAVPLPFQKGICVTRWLEEGPLDSLNPYYYCKGDFENIKAMGFDHVRVPIQFERFFFDDKYTVHPELLGIIDDLVRYAEELRMYFVIDFHNATGYDSKTGSNVEKMLLSVWTQLAERYKNSSEYVIYEIMNEPHGIAQSKWGTVQGKVLTKIRSIDTKHYVVLDSLSGFVDSMLKLPKYKDDKIIYSFHFYEPLVFVFQGAPWLDGFNNFSKIPFPLVRVEDLNLSNEVKNKTQWALDEYKKCAVENYYEKRFDQIAKFSKDRNAPVWNGETGIYKPNIKPEDRNAWLKMMSDHCIERGIPYAIWEFVGGSGLFNDNFFNNVPKFPENLDKAAVESLGLSVPKNSKNKSWSEYYKASGEYLLYKNGMCPRVTYEKWNDGITFKNIEKPENSTIREKCARSSSGSGVRMYLLQHADMSSLVSTHSLEVTVKNENPNLNLCFIFENEVKNEYELQKGFILTARDIPADGNWHTVKIPLSKFQSWIYNPKNIKITETFTWSDVDNLFFYVNKGDDKLLEFKEIKVVK